MNKKLAIRLVGVMMALAFFGSSAFAQFRLRVEDTGGTGTGVVITDNGVGDMNPAAGAITFSGGIGTNFTVNVTTGLSKPVIGGIADLGQIDLNSVNVASTGAGTLRITLEDTGFVGPVNQTLAVAGTVGGTLTAPAGSTILVQSWANGGNAVIDLGTNTFPAGSLAGNPIGGIPAGSSPVWPVPGFLSGPGAFSSTSATSFNNGAVNTFSLFAQVTISFAGPGSVSFDENQTAAVPEPASLLLLGTGLAGIGLLGRRKRNKTQA